LNNIVNYFVKSYYFQDRNFGPKIDGQISKFWSKHFGQKSRFSHAILNSVLASSIIVNFLVTIINEINEKTKKVNDEMDILTYIINKQKTRLKRKKMTKREILLRTIIDIEIERNLQEILSKKND